MARAVNFVWNYCNETQQKAARARRRWLSGFDLQKLTAGSSAELGLHSHSIQRVCVVYAESRRIGRKAWLRWRGRKSLGWVPFNTGHVRFDGAKLHFHGAAYSPMHLHPALGVGAKIGAGSFNQDTQGRWYINIPVQVRTAQEGDRPAVGIDLGLKSLAALSSGQKIAAPAFYREAERRLASAHRARKTAARVRRLNTKVANRRKDFLHKASAAIAKQHSLIVVGDVSPSNLAQTSMAKSVHDAGWSGFRKMLAYKAIRHGARYLEVSENMSTQTCSTCGALPPSRPKGNAGLRIREWTCDDCGAVHDRDVNAARNILRLGHQALVEGAAKSGDAITPASEKSAMIASAPSVEENSSVK